MAGVLIPALMAGASIAGSYMNSNGAGSAQARQQERLNKVNMKASKEMWDYTNYENQRKHIENAGLNVGLMYGSAGAPGSSAGAMGAMASDEVSRGQLGLQKQQIGMQMARQVAELENIKSQTNKNNADAGKTAGIDTDVAKQGLAKLIAETTNEATKGRLMEIESDLKRIEVNIQGKSQDWIIRNIQYNAENAAETLAAALRANEIGDETKNDVIREIQAKSIGAALQNTLTKAITSSTYSDINLNNAKIKEITNTVQQKWDQLAINWKNLTVDQKNAETNKFEAELKAQYPALEQVKGAAMRELLDGVFKIAEKIDNATGTAWGNYNQWKGR